jgi:hypothetical protein
VGGDHHVRHIEELDNRLEHHRGCEVSAKYGTAATPSPSPTIGGGVEEDAGAGSGNEGKGGEQA